MEAVPVDLLCEGPRMYNHRLTHLSVANTGPCPILCDVELLGLRLESMILHNPLTFECLMQLDHSNGTKLAKPQPPAEALMG